MKNMKNILFKLFILSGLVLITRCEDPDNAIYTVLRKITPTVQFFVLKVIHETVSNLTVPEPDQAFFVKIEQQDEENGDLLERVDVYVTLNGSSYSEAKAATFERAAFTENDNGLNEIEISLTLTQAISAIGAASSDYSGGDSITCAQNWY